MQDTNSTQRPSDPILVRALRWIPFTALSLASVWAANDAPKGRRAPQFDWTLSMDAVLNALTKLPHIGSTFAIMLAAGAALGSRRLTLAAVLTFLVSAAWEVSQSTVVGHNPRLADLFPNALGILLGWIAFAAIARLVTKWR
ncbi:VanZ family protein [Devosia sp. Naph2]|uniref:VanZ family protein n=1 Tax=Devosia polycyclovorans TaxID=3345148 RepID=UPI0035D00966